MLVLLTYTYSMMLIYRFVSEKSLTIPCAIVKVQLYHIVLRFSLSIVTPSKVNSTKVTRSTRVPAPPPPTPTPKKETR